jgi:hypothetical protein
MFGKLFKKKAEDKKTEVVALKSLSYPPEIILTWAKAIEGNVKLQNWLLENGYSELYFSVFAIYLKDEPRDWLVKNGYAHLMAMINACEGNANAGIWLLNNNFPLLYHIARAVDHEEESWLWLRANSSIDIFELAKSIQLVKDQIEDNHNDIHSINKDF